MYYDRVCRKGIQRDFEKSVAALLMKNFVFMPQFE